VLVPPLGIAGAGIALCGAYAAMLGVMHFLTRSLFEVAFEWRRLAHIVLVMGGIAVIGDLALPTHGAVGLLSRIVAFLAIVPALYLTGFAHPEEVGNLRRVLGRVRGRIPR
jgi:hypothetical protein